MRCPSNDREIFTVIKMGFVVKRLDKLKDRSDTVLIEVKEQIVSFQANKPTIRIMVNSVPQDTSMSGRVFTEIVVKNLKSALKVLDNSTYDKDSKKIICGKCFKAFKPRDTGGAKTVVTYFEENHFKICGNKEKKRKAREEADEMEKKKKKEEVEKMDKYWSAQRSKDLSVNIDNEADDAFDDPDLNVEQSEVEVASLPGTSSSISG